MRRGTTARRVRFGLGGREREPQPTRGSHRRKNRAQQGAGENDVLIVSFKSKMNTIGPSVIEGLTKAIELAEADYKGVVIWQTSALKLGNPGGAFSAGANLEEAMPAFMTGGAKGIEPFVKKFQQGMLRVKYASVPVVSESAMARVEVARVAHAEPVHESRSPYTEPPMWGMVEEPEI